MNIVWKNWGFYAWILTTHWGKFYVCCVYFYEMWCLRNVVFTFTKCGVYGMWCLRNAVFTFTKCSLRNVVFTECGVYQMGYLRLRNVVYEMWWMWCLLLRNEVFTFTKCGVYFYEMWCLLLQNVVFTFRKHRKQLLLWALNIRRWRPAGQVVIILASGPEVHGFHGFFRAQKSWVWLPSEGK